MKDKFIILVYPNGNYVGLDRMSGGYPYQIHTHKSKIIHVLKEVHVFKSREEAEDYRDMFPLNNFEVKEITVEIS